MNRWVKSLGNILTAIAALGLLALVGLFVTQVIAIALAVAVGFIVTIAYEWQSGLLAGIIAYVIAMKIAWYFEIFDMIGLPTKKRAKSNAKKSLNP